MQHTESDRGSTEKGPVEKCPVCAGGKIRSFMVVGDNGHLRRADVRLPLWLCPDCDIFFLNPPPPAHVGREYFAGAYASERPKSLYYDDTFKDRVSNQRLDLIAEQGAAGGRLLDVGCGKGQFVAVARQRGWEAWGVELDAGACDHARNELGLQTVLNGSLDHPDLPASFDVVTLWDVIEHVPDPVSLLQQVHDRLATGGLLVVRTANIRSFAFDKNRQGWWAFGSDHRFYFSPGSLRIALGRAGLNTRAVLNRETVERADKRGSGDIADTSLAEGLRAVTRAPGKVLKLAHYARNRWRRAVGLRRYGAHYTTSLMTVIASRD